MAALNDLKPLILKGKIQVFEDIFDYVTVKQVATAMGCGVKQVEAIRRDHSVMTLKQLYGLSEGVGMEWRKVIELFAE
jgi:hypothetical protein